MSHKPNLLSWDQDVAASPREFHETDNNRTNSGALLTLWQYFSFRHIRFSKLLSYQKLSQIILSYFSNALPFEQGQRSFQISGKLSSFAKITNKNIARQMFTLETPPPSLLKIIKTFLSVSVNGHLRNLNNPLRFIMGPP